MKKSRENIFILSFILVIVAVASYMIYQVGVTNKLGASVLRVDSDGSSKLYDNLPKINSVINSSGQKYVNNDAVLTINASSDYNIVKIMYSSDLKHWNEINSGLNDKEITTKLIFDKDINKTIYIKAVNEKGYESYSYKTDVKIDKTKPTINISKDKYSAQISVKDNVGLSFIQYSNDNMNWENEEISGKTVTINKSDLKYKYIRAVDLVGNISDVIS